MLSIGRSWTEKSVRPAARSSRFAVQVFTPGISARPSRNRRESDRTRASMRALPITCWNSTDLTRAKAEGVWRWPVFSNLRESS